MYKLLESNIEPKNFLGASNFNDLIGMYNYYFSDNITTITVDLALDAYSNKPALINSEVASI